MGYLIGSRSTFNILAIEKIKLTTERGSDEKVIIDRIIINSNINDVWV